MRDKLGGAKELRDEDRVIARKSPCPRLKECPQCALAFKRRQKNGMEYVPSFRTLAELKQHGRVLHGELACPLCLFRFESRHARHNHLKHDHGLKAKEIAVLTPWRSYPRVLDRDEVFS